MALKDDLEYEVDQIFRRRSWTSRKGQVIPEPSDLTLLNDAVDFERVTVLYADLSGSTDMVDAHSPGFAGEIYKTYLFCAAKLIRAEGGVITSYDGDRVMGVFIGEPQTTPAARCALKLNAAVRDIINPTLAEQYPKITYRVSQVVGIDTSSVRATRTGVRGGNDIVWVGRAANYAAKLTALNVANIHSWMTADAFTRTADSLKTYKNQTIWTKYKWSQFGDKEIYGSGWTWAI